MDPRNSAVLLYCKKILNELKTLSSSVLNIKNNVTILQNDMTKLKNIPIIANESAVRNKQNGTVNQTAVASSSSYKRLSVDAYITPVANVSKCLFDHSITVQGTGGMMGIVRIRNISVTLLSNRINISFEAALLDGSNGNISISGDWQIIEFY